MRTNKFIIICCVILTVLSLAVGQAKADTWYLNTSNSNLGLAGNFASVDITVADHTATFTIDANQALLGTGTNFGIQSFFFNTALNTIDVGDFSVTPTGWGVPNNFPQIHGYVADGFGSFEVKYSGNGSSRLDPLIFMITDPGITSVLDFYELNTAGHHFAAHIAGFAMHNGYDSAYFTDGNGGIIIPEPGTLLLIGIGLMGLAIVGKRRMNS